MLHKTRPLQPLQWPTCLCSDKGRPRHPVGAIPQEVLVGVGATPHTGESDSNGGRSIRVLPDSEGSKQEENREGKNA